MDRRKVELFRKSYNQISKIPPQEYIEYDVLLNDAQAVWEQAKKTDDFALFAPYLEKIVGFNQKFAGYYNPFLIAVCRQLTALPAAPDSVYGSLPVA